MPGVNLPKDFDVEAHKRAARKFANTLPTRENCDLSNPLEMFLWMLVAPPGQNGGHQAMPSSYNMLVSQALYQRGAMLQCEACGFVKEPDQVYVKTEANDPHWMTDPGKWVDREKAPQVVGDPVDAFVDGLPNQVQAAVFRRLQKLHDEGSL